MGSKREERLILGQWDMRGQEVSKVPALLSKAKYYQMFAHDRSQSVWLWSEGFGAFQTCLEILALKLQSHMIL